MSVDHYSDLAPSQQPEAKAAAKRRADAFLALNAANMKVSRCRREDSLQAARAQASSARREYEAARDAHDQLMEILTARQVQRGWAPA